VTADASQVLVESVWGKGSVLAAGRADLDRFTVDKKNSSITSRRVGRKQVRVSDIDHETMSMSMSLPRTEFKRYSAVRT